MKVGDQVTVYCKVRDIDEVCDRGEYHSVPIYIVKRITVTAIKQELVEGLTYNGNGYGDVLYAIDAQGREYRKQPHWDGPRATVWLRRTTEPYGGARTLGFDQYPRHVFSRDVAGRALHLEQRRRA